jgi:hypothetical protein
MLCVCANLQSEVILHCGLSPYQSALYDIVKEALKGMQHTPNPPPQHPFFSSSLCIRFLQSEVILHCGLSPYQSALYDIVKAALRAERDKAKAVKGPGALAAAKGVKGINNTVMELRCICNHPMLRYRHAAAAAATAKSACHCLGE